MKKLFVTLVSGLLFLNAQAFAQSTDTTIVQKIKEVKPVKTYFDIVINIVSNNLNYGNQNDAVSNYKKSANGLQAGISFQAGITPSFSLVSEFYYIRKGGNLKNGNPLTGAESAIRLNALELPLLARYNLGKFHINAGPSIAYNFSGTTEMNGQSSGLVFNSSANGFNRFDAGVQFGGGVEFPVKQRRIELDIRYGYGLTDIAATNQLYNRAIMISVHFSKAWKKNPLAKK
ncbi:PorT family protein [Mucilaginibacter terrigena]|uniref:PorT family protein n=1 Tax=Mucilaginibacter terrigena TaxID=2492395 RepID=A0A4Q5LR55_9SPHI|nr:porin family protein [Mucilaginibacter terrigena]RYU91924.1 PorT family protein [Mucilaginibacter terrigena]